MIVRVATIFVVGAMLAGCGPQEIVDPGSQPPSNGLNPNEIGPPPQSSGGACHDVTGAGVGVVQDQRSMTVPPLTGGTMVDGRYVLTRYEWYLPNQLHTRTIVLVISGGGQYGQYFWHRNQEAAQRMTVLISTQGERITMSASCPAGYTLEWDRYTVNDGGLTLFSTADSKAAFFVRQ